MTTNTNLATPAPVNPGAVIVIKLSDSALNYQNKAQDLGSVLNALFDKQKSIVGSDGISGTIAASNPMSVGLANKQTVKFAGKSDENPGPAPEGGKPGSIFATSVTTADPNVSSSVTKGDMKFSYQRTDKTITINDTGSKISSYQFDSLNGSGDPTLGKTSTSYKGALETQDTTNFNPETFNAFLHGQINNLSFGAAKLIKSAVINGNLNIVASNEFVPPTEPVTHEVPALYVTRTTVSGTIDNVNASYYDGSYFRIKAATGVSVDGHSTIASVLSQSDLWSGDDDVRIELPAHMEKTWILNTGAGNDKVTARGGGGELMINTGSGDDQITLLDGSLNARGGDGIDTLREGFGDIELTSYDDIENFIYTGNKAVTVSGNDLDNDLTGGKLSDVMHGGWGKDILRGLGGNDTLDGGWDHDLLFGGDGNDLLDGGEEGDVMWGGAGNDTYVVDNLGDVVNEARSDTNAADSGGRDTVQASVNFALGPYLENLQMTGDGDITGIGNALANVITGNSGSNEIRGEGGNDTLIGNGGNDTISGGAGNDLLDGGDGNDVLDGGLGADGMRGGAGNDDYTVDNAGDRVFESMSATNKADAGGVDTVHSSISFTLADNFENLELTGTANITGTGNAAANIITGNAGDNLINGKGEVDKLDGAGGSDIYLISSSAEHAQAEITDTGAASDVDEVRFSPSAQARPVPGAVAETSTLKLYAGDTGIERVVVGTGAGKFAVTTGKVAADIDASAVQNGLTLAGNDGANHLIGTDFNDTLIGNGGHDVLTGGLGADKFVFNMGQNASTNVDRITDFVSGEDQIVLLRSKFGGIGTGDSLQDGAFFSGAGASKAQDASDRMIFDTDTGKLYFDKDGSGGAAAVLIGVFDPAAHLAATDFKIVDVV